MDNNLIKFTVILICFIIALAARKKALDLRDGNILVAAMFFTLAADFFLVIMHIYPIGVFIFCAAHVLYSIRFAGKRAIKFMPIALIIPAIYFFIDGDILITVSLLYANLFILSYSTMVIALIKKTYPTPNAILIFIGMSAFFICDIFVATAYLGRWGVFENYDLTAFAADAIWLFYAPSQICLSLSALKFKKEQ